MTTMAAGELKAQHGTLFAVIANRVDEASVIADTEAITFPGIPAFAIPEEPLLSAPSVGDLLAACEGRLVSGDESLLGREATGFVVATLVLDETSDLEPPARRVDRTKIERAPRRVLPRRPCRRVRAVPAGDACLRSRWRP